VLNTGEQKSLQIKTLTNNSTPDGYRACHVMGYSSDLLIAMVNKDRTRFGLEFAGNIISPKFTLSFKSGTSKYENIMF
jgi:hypothetical protein